MSKLAKIELLSKLVRDGIPPESAAAPTAGTIKTGDFVLVGPHPLERNNAGRVGVFQGITRTHGYAIVAGTDNKYPDVILVHPEALQPHELPEGEIDAAIYQLTEERR